jgi:hypothetical protein
MASVFRALGLALPDKMVLARDTFSENSLSFSRASCPSTW